MNDNILKTRIKKPLRACMLAYTFYETDGRVMRYAEALKQEGYDVEAIVLRRDRQTKEEVINGVNVLRIQRRVKNESGKLSYFVRIIKFFFRSMYEITRRHLKAPYHVIHVHSVPDFEVFAAFVPKFLGAKIILDIHDIVPEFYAAKFRVTQDSLAFKALKLVEKQSAAFSDHVIISNDLWLEKLTARSAPKDKCSSYINYPDLSIFNPSFKKAETNDKFVMIYPGTLNWHQGLDIAVNALAVISEKAPNMELHIYGEGSEKMNIQKQIVELHLSGKVLLKPPLPLKIIATLMANADLGIVPKRDDLFGGEAFSTKILEFMALGVPVIVAGTRIDKYYFDDSLVRFFKAGDVNDLARVMLESYTHREDNYLLASRSLEFARQHSWNKKKSDYLSLIERFSRGNKRKACESTNFLH